jgi:hypothetical protein
MLWQTLARGVKQEKTRAYGKTIRVEVKGRIHEMKGSTARAPFIRNEIVGMIKE